MKTQKLVLYKSGTDLINKSTNNSAVIKTVCWVNRPCYRIRQCEYCYNRKRKYIIKQFISLSSSWNFEQFVTISFLNTLLVPRNALAWLSCIRSELFCRLFRKTKYFSVMAIGSFKDGSTTPHIHVVTKSSITKQIVSKCIGKIDRDLIQNANPLIHIHAIGSHDMDFRKIGGYMLDQNYRYSLPFAPRRMRLITTSRGLKVGNPQSLSGIQ